jgi:hypothetical protein
MATPSFDKKFEITDKKVAIEFLKAFENPDTIKVNKKDLEQENKIGLELLKKAFSNKKHS